MANPSPQQATSKMHVVSHLALCVRSPPFPAMHMVQTNQVLLHVAATSCHKRLKGPWTLQGISPSGPMNKTTGKPKERSKRPRLICVITTTPDTPDQLLSQLGNLSRFATRPCLSAIHGGNRPSFAPRPEQSLPGLIPTSPKATSRGSETPAYYSHWQKHT
jgi:hypothetical protein